MPKRTALFVAMAVLPSLSFAGDIPDVRVGPFTFTDAPIHYALTEIVKGTRVSVVMADEIPGTLTAVNVSGKLDVIVGKMCAYAEAQCDFKDGAIVVKSRGKPEQSVAAAPSAAPRLPLDVVVDAPPAPAVVPALADVPAPVAPERSSVQESPSAPVSVVALADAGSHDLEPPRALDLPEQMPAPFLEIFVRNGESLRTALAREATKMQLKLSWSLREDRVASRDMTFTGSSRDDVLNDILVAFRLPGYLVESTNTLYIVKDPK